MRQIWRRYYARWLAWRMPAARQQRLHQRLIFILPTGYGMLFLAVALAVFIAGINYQNNLLLGLAFFRSEERRVGKECRRRWSVEHCTKNTRKARSSDKTSSSQGQLP